MIVLRRVGILVVALVAMSGMIQLVEHFTIEGVPAFGSTAKAAVGRPLTPVSVAGVARRSARR